MAVTKIWKVKDRLDFTINYAVNGEKTEEKLYVSGINCMSDTALQEMRNIKNNSSRQVVYNVFMECNLL